MIKIATGEAAIEAICATMPVGSAGRGARAPGARFRS
jgi:hypothetical protein